MIYRHYFFGSNYASFALRLSLFILFYSYFGLLYGVLAYLAFDFILLDYLILHSLFGYSLMTNGSDVVVLEIRYVIAYYVTLDRKINNIEALKRQFISSRQGLERFTTYPAMILGKYYEKRLRGKELKE